MKKNEQKTDAWMPLYIGDYLGATQRLTTEQHGAYLLLLIDYWRNGPPPNDDEVLAQITRLKAGAWRKQKPVILGFFKEEKGGLVHARAEAERAKAVEHRARAIEKAQKAANARWQDQGSKSDTPSNAQAMLEAMLVACPPPSPCSVSKETGGKPPKDLAKEVFDRGVSLLVEKGSKPGPARSMVGKWRKSAGDSVISSLIGQAIEKNITDPGPWILAGLQRSANDTSDFYAAIDRTFRNCKGGAA